MLIKCNSKKCKNLICLNFYFRLLICLIFFCYILLLVLVVRIAQFYFHERRLSIQTQFILTSCITKHITRKLLLVYQLFVENNYTVTSFVNTQRLISKIINLNHSNLIALKRYRRDLTSKFDKCQYKQLIYNYSLYYITQNWPV